MNEMHMSAENQNALVLGEQLCARASQDEDLKSRLPAEPHATLEAETGLTIPAGWQVVAAVQADCQKARQIPVIVPADKSRNTCAMSF